MTAQHVTTNGPMLEIVDLHVCFHMGRKRQIRAVSGVSFTIERNETLGLVGESGCGKSSLARAIMQLPPPTSGRVLLAGRELTVLKGASLRAIRPRLQMVFQDPVSSLNPGRRVGRSIGAPLRTVRGADKAETASRVRSMMTAVGLDPEQYTDQHPGRLSGGQCQRASIARALITGPDVLICDEPISALDVSVQAQILNLLNRIKADFGLAMLFISHDLAVVKRVSDRVAVMYLGRICELASVEALYSRPAHPYTAALLDAIPKQVPRARRAADYNIPIEPRFSLYPLSGCHFHPRCPRAKPHCVLHQPIMSVIEKGHSVACHFPLLGSPTV